MMERMTCMVFVKQPKDIIYVGYAFWETIKSIIIPKQQVEVKKLSDMYYAVGDFNDRYLAI